MSDENTDAWDMSSRTPLEVLGAFRRAPAWSGLLALNTVLLFWLAFSPHLGPSRAAWGGLIFVILWAVMAAFLPTVFKVLFLVLVLAAAGGSFILLSEKTDNLLNAGLLAFSGTGILAVLCIAFLRGEVLIPLGLAGVAGLCAYLELGQGWGPIAGGALVFAAVFAAVSGLCYAWGPFVVGCVWVALMGLVAQKLVSACFLGLGIAPDEARDILSSGLALVKGGGKVSALLALLARAWAPVRPPGLLPVCIGLVAAVVGGVRQATRLGVREDLDERQEDFIEEARTAMAMGEELLKEGRLDEALKFFDRVAELDTAYRDTGMFYVALIHLRKGDAEMGKRAAARLDSGVMSNQQRYLLGTEFERRGDLEQAQIFLEKLSASDPAYSDVSQRLESIKARLTEVSGDEIAHLVAKRVIDRRYLDVKLIARGAMGFVFKSKDSKAGNREVAIKVMSPLVSEGKKEASARFIREAEMVSAVLHENVIRIFDVVPGNLPYYSMEYVRAQSLADILKIRGRLERDLALKITRQMCAGLGAAHAKGIIHRDVKPANVLIDEDMDAKLVDFGIAKYEGATKLTQTGASVGTPLYMSPEQVKAEEVGPFSDVYSTGVVLYEMLAGRPPFEEMTHHVTKPVPPMPAEAQVPPDLFAVVLRALSKAPQDRYQAAEHFAHALKFWRSAPESPPDSGGLIDLTK